MITSAFSAACQGFLAGGRENRVRTEKIFNFQFSIFNLQSSIFNLKSSSAFLMAASEMLLPLSIWAISLTRS